MAVTVFKTFSAGEILTASDLNSSFTQITTNGEDLAWPATKAKDLNGNELILDADADTSITADTDDRIDFKLQGVDLFKFDGSTASAVDGITFGAVATGSPSTVTVTAQGSSTDINLNLVPKGSGVGQIAGATIGTLSNLVEDTTPQLGGRLDANGKVIGWDKGGDIASASPLVLGTDGNYFDVTGTTGFSTITVAANTLFMLQFDDALTLTHGAPLNIPGAANITTAAGDEALCYATAADTVRILVYTRASDLAMLQGKHTIWIPSAAMRPTISNGCTVLTDFETTAGRPDLQLLYFDGAADEASQFQMSLPKSWNEGTITFQAVYSVTDAAATHGTDTVSWALQGVSVSDDESADQAYGTAIVVTDTTPGTVEDIGIAAESAALTLGGTPAEGDLSFFRLFRDVSADDMTEDAGLVGTLIFISINEGNDA